MIFRKSSENNSFKKNNNEENSNNIVYLKTLNERKYQKYLNFLIKEYKDLNEENKKDENYKKGSKIKQIIKKVIEINETIKINKIFEKYLDYNGLFDDEKKIVEKSFHVEQQTYQKMIKDDCTKDFQNEIIEQYYMKSFYINKKNAVVLCYENGCYYDIGERILKNEYIRFIGSDTGNDNLSGILAKTTEINDFIKTTVSVSEIEQEDFNQQEHIINFNNCCYDIKSSKPTQHSPEYNFRYKLPFDFDVNAKCPGIDKIIDEIFEHNINKEKTLYECISTSLMKGYKNKLIVMGMGPPNTGKTTLFNIISEFLGERNIQHLSMSQLTDDMFAAIELSNKIASLSDELSPFSGKSLNLMKSISGNGIINVRGLHSSYQKLRNEATIWQFGNYEDLILTSKDETAFFKRVVLLLFENEFSQDRNNEIIGILDGLDENEYSGMANKVIEGYKRLEKNNEFTCCRKNSYEKCQVIADKQYNPSILAFTDNHVKKTIDVGDECEFIYNKYVEYYKENYIEEPISQILFNKTLRTWFDTNNKVSNSKRIWNNLVYHNE